MPPEVFQGPFEAAHEAAREQKRLLLVWTLGWPWLLACDAVGIDFWEHRTMQFTSISL